MVVRQTSEVDADWSQKALDYYKCKCENTARRYQKYVDPKLTGYDYGKEAIHFCGKRKEGAVAEIKRKSDDLSRQIEAGIGVQANCTKMNELDEEKKSIITKAVDGQKDEQDNPDQTKSSCQYSYRKCGMKVQSLMAAIQSEAQQDGSCDKLNDIYSKLQAKQEDCKMNLEDEQEKLRTSLASIEKSAKVNEKCQCLTKADGEGCDEDPDDPTKKKGPKGGKTAGGDGDKGSGKSGDQKKPQQAGGGMPQMPQMPQSASQSPQMAQAQELSDDSCYKPGAESKPGCQCLLTGNCRNPDAKEVAALAPAPGTGGAQLIKNTGVGPSFNSGPMMPAMQNAEGAHAAGAVGGAGGGGGGGIGGGGAGKPDAPTKPKARSALAADILQGVRGGAGGKGGGRTHPGFAGMGEWKSSSHSSSGDPVDMSKFVPDSRMPASLGSAIPTDMGGVGTGPANLHPASANIFHEVSRHYHEVEGSLGEPAP